MWASFNFDALQKWLEECRKPNAKNTDVSKDMTLVKQGESIVTSGDQFSTVFNIEENWFIPEYCILLKVFIHQKLYSIAKKNIVFPETAPKKPKKTSLQRKQKPVSGINQK